MHSNNRHATEKQKLIQEKCVGILTSMLKDEDNKYCVDCDAKGPRWASWNLGVFLCIRCAGIHRNLGVHISKVKSINLDTWKPEQAVALQQMGNSRARAVYEANLPDNFRRPQTDASLEAFIRAKYEQNKYTAREWVPPKVPKVNWDAEVEALQREHRRPGVRGRVEQPATPVLQKPLPAPAAPATAASSAAAAATRSRTQSPQQKATPALAPPAPTASPAPASSSAAADLLGLDTPLPSTVNNNATGDVFGDFLSAAPATETAPATSASDSLAAEEANFFSQPAAATESTASGAKVMSKDSILALFGQCRPGGPPPPAGGRLAGLNMPAASVAGGVFPAQQIPTAFPQQQQMPTAFPQQQPAAFPQQQPAAFPQQQPAAFSQQQQTPSTFPQQQQPAAFPQQQQPVMAGFQQLPAGFAQQPQSMPAAFGGQQPMTGFGQQQLGAFPGQQPVSTAASLMGQQSFSMGYQMSPQQPAPQYHSPLHQQMSGLALADQQQRSLASVGAFPPISGAPQLNGQLWQ